MAVTYQYLDISLKTTAIILLFMLDFTRCSYKNICREARCEYFFSVRHARSMTYHTHGVTYNVMSNGTRLVIAENSLRPEGSTSKIGQEVPADDVITLDGVPATLITINNQFPGPTLEVMEGAEVRETRSFCAGLNDNFDIRCSF